ncbi:nitroreductase family protein [Desulfolithobacter sp.]
MDKHEFSEFHKEGVYQAIFQRRDIRAQFIDKPVPDDLIEKLLRGAHHAPSVGFMQPWNFLVIRDRSRKERVHRAFKRANEKSAEMFDEKRRKNTAASNLKGFSRRG